MNGLALAIRRYCFRCPHPRACRPCVYREYRRADLIRRGDAWTLWQAFGERLEGAGEVREEGAR